MANPFKKIGKVALKVARFPVNAVGFVVGTIMLLKQSGKKGGW